MEDENEIEVRKLNRKKKNNKNLRTQKANATTLQV